MLTIGSLCSGACDGLSLGLEWAGLGPTVWQVEKEPDRRANLARHWPTADRSVESVEAANAGNLARVDVVVCSAPCQDLSSAGKKAGLTGSRSSVWFECQRVVGELGPRFVVAENVASGASNWVPYVRSGLERLGYSTLPIPIAAADCGAPHLRRRVFVLAVADCDRKLAGTVHDEVAESPETLANVARYRRNEGSELGRQTRRDTEREGGSGSGEVSDTDCAELRIESRRSGGSRRLGRSEPSNNRAHAGWPLELEVVPPLHGVSGQLVSWLGDSVVPQCAEVVGYVIRELAGIGEGGQS